jgi:hypothetical protein
MIVVMKCIDFCAQIPATTQDGLSGYLFLCPTNDFKVTPSLLRWPDCPTYWSLDPGGVQRLNPEEATALGFPLIDLTINIRGCSWDSTVYTGLRDFHRAKGFDSDSQDVAHFLWQPFFQTSTEIDPPFEHGKFAVSLKLPVVPHDTEQ